MIKMHICEKLTIFACGFCLFISACKKQTEFDAQKWQDGKHRYEMTDDLIKKLEKENPHRSEVEKMLGLPEFDDNTREKSLMYFLKSDDLIFGLSMYFLVIYFDETGIFERAEILYSD